MSRRPARRRISSRVRRCDGVLTRRFFRPDGNCRRGWGLPGNGTAPACLPTLGPSRDRAGNTSRLFPASTLSSPVRRAAAGIGSTRSICVALAPRCCRRVRDGRRSASSRAAGKPRRAVFLRGAERGGCATTSRGPLAARFTTEHLTRLRRLKAFNNLRRRYTAETGQPQRDRAANGQC